MVYRGQWAGNYWHWAWAADKPSGLLWLSRDLTLLIRLADLCLSSSIIKRKRTYLLGATG